jgi:predicted site-specific integrase-resolvase
MRCLAAKAAKILDVTPATIRAMVRRGELKAERTSNGVSIFDEDELEEHARRRAELARRRAEELAETRG